MDFSANLCICILQVYLRWQIYKYASSPNIYFGSCQFYQNAKCTVCTERVKLHSVIFWNTDGPTLTSISKESKMHTLTFCTLLPWPCHDITMILQIIIMILDIISWSWTLNVIAMILDLGHHCSCCFLPFPANFSLPKCNICFSEGFGATSINLTSPLLVALMAY